MTNRFGCLFIIACLHGIIYFYSLSWLVVPFALFVVFLASGGPRFPFVFFRTFFRDMRFIWLTIFTMLHTIYYSHKNYSITDIFHKTVKKYPNEVAFKFEGRNWTLTDVDVYSNRVANFFLSKGYKKGDVVALVMENRPEYVCLWLGLGKIGVITSLINTHLRLDSLLHCITVCNAKGLIFSADYSDAIGEIHEKLPNSLHYFSHGGNSSSIPCVSLDCCLKDALSTSPTIDYKINFTDILMYIFTSGTTGLPKPAVIRTSRFFLSSLLSYAFNVGHQDVLYCTLPLYHSAGTLLGMSFCLVHGATIVIRRKFSASQFFDECVEHKVTVVQYIGELCRFLLTQPPRPSDVQHSIRLALGNGLRPKIWTEFQSRFKIKQIGEFYAATEGTCSGVNIDNTAGAVGFISRIFPSIFPSKIIRIDEKTGEILRDVNGMAIDCKPGEPGEIVGRIIPPNTKAGVVFRFDGYLSKSATAKKVGHNIFKKGDTAFLSGDIIVQDEYGYIYFQDRTGDTFRWHGENVSSAEVESIISKALGLCNVVVYGVKIPDIEGNAGMAAIVDQEESLDMGSLAEKLKSLLPGYAIPIFVRVVKSVAMTGTFKFQKYELKKEGFDINVVKDKLYYYDSQSKVYLPLDENLYGKIIDGKVRL